MTIPYVQQTWTDGVSDASAARMTVIEQGIHDAHRMPSARVYHNAAQSIAHNTVTMLALNSERFDTDTIHDTATNNSRLTCKTAGQYQITGNVAWAANATGIRQVNVRLNAATQIAAQSLPAVNAQQEMVVATLYSLAVNDYVELGVYQTSGGNLNVVTAGNHSPEFMMVRVA